MFSSLQETADYIRKYGVWIIGGLITLVLYVVMLVFGGK